MCRNKFSWLLPAHKGHFMFKMGALSRIITYLRPVFTPKQRMQEKCLSYTFINGQSDMYS